MTLSQYLHLMLLLGTLALLMALWRRDVDSVAYQEYRAMIERAK